MFELSWERPVVTGQELVVWYPDISADEEAESSSVIRNYKWRSLARSATSIPLLSARP